MAADGPMAAPRPSARMCQLAQLFKHVGRRPLGQKPQYGVVLVIDALGRGRRDGQELAETASCAGPQSKRARRPVAPL
eukprot:4422818-Pyramimonas_sp.AAC.1